MTKILNDSEIIRITLGLFIGLATEWIESVRGCNDILEAVYKAADRFSNTANYVNRISGRNTKRIITETIIKWAAGSEDVDVDTLVDVYNNYYWSREDKYNNYASPDNQKFVIVKEACKRYTEEREKAERFVFSAHYLRPSPTPELSVFAENIYTMYKLRHQAICKYDMEKLLAYGYMKGVQAERQRQKKKVNKNEKSK